MTKEYMHQVMIDEKIDRVVGPLSIIYLLWLFLAVQFSFKTFIASVAIVTGLLIIYAIFDLIVFSPKKG